MIQNDRYYLRDPRVSVVSRGDSSWCSIGGDERRELAVYHDPLAATLVLHTTVPTLGRDLAARLAGAPQALALLDRMIADGVVLVGAQEELVQRCMAVTKPPKNRVKHMVVGVTGGVYASLVAPFLYHLPHSFCERLDVVMTKSATHFLTPRLFDHLGNLGIRCFGDTFEAKEGVRVPHIELAHGTDMVVIFPATAHSLHRFASGSCSDLISLIVTSTRAPVVMFPVMNETMWTAPAVSRNVALLRKDGHYVVEPGPIKEVSKRGLELMVGGPGVRWDRPEELISLLSSILEIHRAPQPDR